MSVEDILPFLYALAIGLLIGFERERSHPPGTKKIGGSRTFALVALSGSLAALLGDWVVVSGLLAVALFLVAGYRRTSLMDPGTTTEIALFATFLLGALTQDEPEVAISLAIIVTVLLASKSRIHGFAHNAVSEIEFEDALKFAVIAFVVFPLLPDKDIGPYGAINPHEIWLLVVAFTGISWVGYIAVRVLGPVGGTLATGLAGGFVSASATTAAMGRRARLGVEGEAVAGALLASVATYIQLEAVMLVASPEIALRLWPSCLIGAGGLIVLALFDWRRKNGVGRGAAEPRRNVAETGPPVKTSEPSSKHRGSPALSARPFAFRSALLLALILSAALVAGRWAAAVFGSGGVYLSAGAAGLADAHAGALASAELFSAGAIELTAALIAIGIALSVNTIVKVVIGFVAGGRSFGMRLSVGIVPAVVLFAVAIGVTAVASAT
jgi:uncharacterized membrane protein (DUF4010 family)